MSDKTSVTPVELIARMEEQLTLSRRATLSVNIARALLEKAEKSLLDVDDGVEGIMVQAEKASIDALAIRKLAEDRLDALLANGFLQLEPLGDDIPAIEITPVRRRRRRSTQEDTASETKADETVETTPDAAAPSVEVPAAEVVEVVEAPVAEAPQVEVVTEREESSNSDAEDLAIDPSELATDELSQIQGDVVTDESKEEVARPSLTLRRSFARPNAA